MGKVKQKESNTKSPPPTFMIDWHLPKQSINWITRAERFLQYANFPYAMTYSKIYTVFICKL